VGDFKNGGRQWRPKGNALEVRVHDFSDKELGEAIPYGVYDVTHNEAWVSVGTDHDTAELGAAAIGRSSSTRRSSSSCRTRRSSRRRPSPNCARSPRAATRGLRALGSIISDS